MYLYIHSSFDLFVSLSIHLFDYSFIPLSIDLPINLSIYLFIGSDIPLAWKHLTASVAPYNFHYGISSFISYLFIFIPIPYLFSGSHRIAKHVMFVLHSLCEGPPLLCWALSLSLCLQRHCHYLQGEKVPSSWLCGHVLGSEWH